MPKLTKCPNYWDYQEKRIFVCTSVHFYECTNTVLILHKDSIKANVLVIFRLHKVTVAQEPYVLPNSSGARRSCPHLLALCSRPHQHHHVHVIIFTSNWPATDSLSTAMSLANWRWWHRSIWHSFCQFYWHHYVKVYLSYISESIHVPYVCRVNTKLLNATSVFTSDAVIASMQFRKLVQSVCACRFRRKKVFAEGIAEGT